MSRLSWYLRDEVNLRALVIGLGSNDAMRGLSLEQALEEGQRQATASDQDRGSDRRGGSDLVERHRERWERSAPEAEQTQ